MTLFEVFGNSYLNRLSKADLVELIRLRTSFRLRDKAGTRILAAEKNLCYYEPITFIHFMTAIPSSLLGCFLFYVPSTVQDLWLIRVLHGLLCPSFVAKGCRGQGVYEHGEIWGGGVFDRPQTFCPWRQCLYSLYTSASYKLNLCIYAMLRVPSTTRCSPVGCWMKKYLERR